MTSNDFISSAALLDLKSNITLNHQQNKATDNPLCRSLFFKFSSAVPGDTITFTQNLADKNGNIGAGMGALSISFQSVKGEKFPKFQIDTASSKWDATGGKLTYDSKK